MTLANVVGVVLFVGVTLYAVFGGADFGSGVWDLLSGSAAKGARSRALIDVAIGPVWEANHVWLIFSLVVLWTAFPSAFAAIMTTLYLPLSMAAIGIVLRGSGFAFRKATTRFRYRQAFGVVFASSSLITPFFMGAVAGGIASGRVPPGGSGDAITSWVNPTSILGGVLAVAACAFLAAVYLTHDAVREGDPVLERLFARRSVASGVVVGVIALAGVFVLRADAPYLFDGLTHEALPLVVLSGVGGIGAMVLADRGRSGLARALAAGAIVAVVWGWGVAQNPYILPEWLTIEQAASPSATLWSVLVVLGIAAVTVVPSLFFLYRLDQRSLLDIDDLNDLARENAG